MKNKLTSIIFFLCILPLVAQHEIKGKIINSENGLPITGANISISETYIGTTSGINGTFSIKTQTIPCKIKVSHIGFQTFELQITKPGSEQLNISLHPEVSILKPVNIHSEKIICLHPDDKYYITDFMILNNTIAALAYKNRQYGNQYLIAFANDGSKLEEQEIKNNKGIFQTPDMNAYIKMQDQGWQVSFDSSEFYFSEPFSPDLIDSAVKYISAIKEDTLLIHQYTFYNQILSYYAIIPEESVAAEIKTYIDEDAIGRLQWGPFFDNNEFDRRFTEQIFFKPVQIPLFVNNNIIIIFNTIDKKIEHISNINGQTIKEVELKTEDEKGWTKTILYDQPSDRFYTTYLRKGIYTVCEVDIYTGKISEKAVLSGYAYIEKLQIWDGNLYFLYKKFTGDDYKRLYMSSLY